MSNSRQNLQSELDALCSEAKRFIQSQRQRSAAIRSFKRYLPVLIIVPATWLVVLVAYGPAPTDLSLWWIGCIALVALAAAVLVAIVAARIAKIDRRDALAEIDRELGLEDRLVTAEEFLGSTSGSPFVAAALADAERVAPAARAAVLRLDREPFELGQRDMRIIAVGSLLLVLGSWIGQRGNSDDYVAEGNAPQTGEVAVIDTRDEDTQTRPEPQAREEHEEPELATIQAAKAEAATTRRDKAGDLSDETKESEGKTGEGRSSDAESTSGASESRGMPSNQSQKSQAGEKPKKKDAKKKAKPPAELQPAEKKKADENSGSTAGKGSSKGSNKNPAVSKWSSKDQVTTQDDQEIEEDEDTEDEEEDQESRGGMQPNLRDRKPPVSRDLRIGFGNQKNPDANGRGGPSEAKKSRGTASLVLGVPIPDRVKGQPNPGKTKITQERIEPKAEESAAIPASARKSREAPAGNVQERELTPWMRTLIREYFLTLRNKNRRS